MEYLYIDESGSMTRQYAKHNPYFVITLVRAPNPDKLRSLHKRFVRKHFDELRVADKDGKMFDGDRFVELKGSSFTPNLKREFVSYFCREGTLEVYYIVVDNKGIKGELYENTARAFNYVLNLALKCFIKSGHLPNDKYIIQLDERNERTDSRHFLQGFLNTNLRMEGYLSEDACVQYFESENNRNIQIADVLSNLYFSNLLTGNYKNEIRLMQDNGCLKFVFRFPL